ncbi:MAG: epoxyqueuosine reductase QueH [Candidatus Buchananbacteria bacterium]
MSKPKLLLHVCCSTCGGYLAQELLEQYDVAIFFDNSNIFPKEEFFRRSDEAKKFFTSQGYEYVQPEYNHEEWSMLVSGLEGEPERGGRCRICYRFRLDKAAIYAKENGFKYFASTLAISPHKDAVAINEIGSFLAKQSGINFLAGDWKKHEGFKKAMQFSCEHDFYRQNYCGCEFSMKS